MNLFKLGAVALAMFLGVSATSASATSLGRVRQYGHVFARNVCGDVQVPGVGRCFAKVLTDARGNILESHPAITRNASTAPAGYSPLNLQSAYKVSGSGGAGYTIAVVDAFGDPSAESDLGVYRSKFGLPPCTTANGCFKKVNQNGGTSYPKADTGWGQETAIDLEMASAMCPNCHLLLVESTNDFINNLSAASNYAALHANAVSNSWGGSESGTSSYEADFNHSGVAITVSSGDSGYGVQFPASSPHVTAVGGTSLVRASNSRGWSETVWNGAGSGCSALYAKPTWQHDGLCAKRTVADVSAIADPNTGIAMYGPINARRSGWMVFGGTSVAAPLVAGIYGAKGTTASYGSNPYSNTTALFDVTSGSNGNCGGTYLCTGEVGYDGPTGLGTPDGTTAF
ncbi:MAG TPA: S53 family peptidase [Sphingomicrobium sp.]|nr:S53 family peptidase [Sphingomicrobium sp.]